jgi:hypothetical protein
MTKKAGRPSVPKHKRRTPALSVRLTAEEKKPIDEAIKASGLGATVWARKSLQYIVSNGICIT